VPKVTVERLSSPPSSTFIRARSLTTGAEMHVMMRSTVAEKRRKVPMWWRKPKAPMLRCWGWIANRRVKG
jgi:hypothetical protein